MKKLVTLTMLAVLVSFAVPASADYLTNGNFEATPFDSSWTNAGTPQNIVHRGLTATGLDATGTQAVYMVAPSAATGFYQNVSGVPLQWQLDFVFAAADSGDNTTRSLNLAVRHAGTSNQINIKLDGDGYLWTYDQGPGWRQISSTTAASFSVDANSDNDFEDAGDTLNVHSLRIVGTYGATPTYDVYLSAANSTTLTLIGDDLAHFQGGNPSSTETPVMVSFITGTGVLGSNYVIDNVSLTPEPATMALLMLGLPLALRRRRK
ncbi:MAG: PEP-CTERM sorting domain-containing protein [Phycisphaerae bacterium]|nr:PEP-CTERM sorting domain-containing protein [Phycisphaerae bacterium]